MTASCFGLRDPVERWFRDITDKRIRQGTFDSVHLFRLCAEVQPLDYTLLAWQVAINNRTILGLELEGILLRILFTLTAICCLATSVTGDIVELRDFTKVYGVILEQNDQALVVCTLDDVQKIPRSLATKAERDTGAITPAVGQLPSWQDVMRLLAGCNWARGIEQIPATVIDDGVLKDVPYRSFRFDRDYEVNIYGDPEHPACVEIGIYRELLRLQMPRLNCRSFAKLLISSDLDKRIIESLSTDGDLVEHQGLTIEITPPSSPDAYGGWWISLYRKDLLDRSRATKQELDTISTKLQVETPDSLKTVVQGTPDQSDLPARANVQQQSTAQNATPPTRPPAATYAPPPENWSQNELSMARSSTSSVGRVYVRGYTRKDGTYVRPHTRRR